MSKIVNYEEQKSKFVKVQNFELLQYLKKTKFDVGQSKFEIFKKKFDANLQSQNFINFVDFRKGQ